MADVLRFISDPFPALGVPTQAVYFKQRWADEWTLMPQLWCSERTWAMAPSMSTASLVFRYGDALSIGATGFGKRFPLNNRLRFYVRVDTTTLPINSDDEQPGLRSWYGVIDVELDEQHGPDLVVDPIEQLLVAYPRGRNHFACYGLESLLAQSWIDRSAVEQGEGTTFVARALSFNPGLADYNPDPCETTGEGNRSAGLAGAGGKSYVFHGARTGGKKWSTYDAVEYLLAYGTVRNYNDEQNITFFLNDRDEALPDWDEPIEACEGRTVFDVVNSLIARQRGLAWRVEVQAAAEGQGPDKVMVIPCTFLAETLTLEGNQKFKRNPNQKILAWERDRGARAVITRSSMDAVDQVIARGERRTSTATFSFMDATLAIGWPSTLETAYEAAASTAGDYPGAGEVEKRQYANFLARQADKYKPVFARFVLPDPFGGYVGDGTSVVADKVLMPSEANEDDPAPHAPDDQRFLSLLALLEGFVYDGDAIDGGNPTESGQKPHKHLQPLVVFPRPNIDNSDTTERYRLAEKVGLTADMAIGGFDLNQDWSADVRIDDDDGALWVSVSNKPQFVIADTDFSRLPDDPADVMPADYQKMLATLSVPWSAFAEAKYPEELTPGNDTARRMYVRAPFHRADYVVPGTVVGLDEKTGVLLRTDSGGYVRDDRPKLAQIARVAFAWYGVNRKAVSLSTSLVNNLLQLGDFIVSIGDPLIEGDIHTEEINSVVTQIRLVTEMAEGEGAVAPPVPRIEYDTAFGELDVLKLVPRLPQH